MNITSVSPFARVASRKDHLCWGLTNLFRRQPHEKETEIIPQAMKRSEARVDGAWWSFADPVSFCENGVRPPHASDSTVF